MQAVKFRDIFKYQIDVKNELHLYGMFLHTI
ncbi:hypothetical protein EDC63_10961 [Sulfurirhabdus autotrophica]|uniref:Uncharacterized protein n=1 Tax=Sulfurirhabdus autotrophica TaxID=1706046 RepID=A0A4R3Y159_9PROT|nr:hypothetical protein EDC63_10961 [Sulfurirhabdus autotrophica]